MRFFHRIPSSSIREEVEKISLEMFKLVAVFTALFVIANAGYISSPIAYHAPIVAAPIAVKAAVPVATSYQSQVQISHGAVPVIAPVYKTAPVIAAPAVIKAPVFAAPAIVKSPVYSFAHY